MACSADSHKADSHKATPPSQGDHPPAGTGQPATVRLRGCHGLLRSGSSTHERQLVPTFAPLFAVIGAVSFAFLPLLYPFDTTEDLACIGAAVFLSASSALLLFGQYPVMRIVNATLVACFICILLLDWKFAAAGGSRRWSVCMLVMDASLIANSDLSLQRCLVALGLAWLVAERAVAVWWPSVYAFASIRGAIPHIHAACAAPPCAVTAVTAVGDTVAFAAVFCIDWYLTRGFATRLRLRNAELESCVAVAEEFSTYLAEYNTERASLLLLGTEGGNVRVNGALRMMLRNLQRYKPYLPHYVVHEPADHDESPAHADAAEPAFLPLANPLRAPAAPASLPAASPASPRAAPAAAALRRDPSPLSLGAAEEAASLASAASGGGQRKSHERICLPRHLNLHMLRKSVTSFRLVVRVNEPALLSHDSTMVLEAIFESVKASHGMVITFDAVRCLATFGAPRLAARCAVTASTCETPTRDSDESERGRGVADTGCLAAVTHGPVYVGAVGTRQRRCLCIVGDAVDRAQAASVVAAGCGVVWPRASADVFAAIADDVPSPSPTTCRRWGKGVADEWVPAAGGHPFCARLKAAPDGMAADLAPAEPGVRARYEARRARWQEALSAQGLPQSDSEKEAPRLLGGGLGVGGVRLSCVAGPAQDSSSSAPAALLRTLESPSVLLESHRSSSSSAPAAPEVRGTGSTAHNNGVPSSSKRLSRDEQWVHEVGGRLDGSGVSHGSSRSHGSSGLPAPQLELEVTKQDGRIGVTYDCMCTIEHVVAGGAGDVAGLRAGMVLREIDARPVTAPEGILSLFVAAPDTFKIKVDKASAHTPPQQQGAGGVVEALLVGGDSQLAFAVGDLLEATGNAGCVSLRCVRSHEAAQAAAQGNAVIGVVTEDPTAGWRPPVPIAGQLCKVAPQLPWVAVSSHDECVAAAAASHILARLRNIDKLSRSVSSSVNSSDKSLVTH